MKKRTKIFSSLVALTCLSVVLVHLSGSDASQELSVSKPLSIPKATLVAARTEKRFSLTKEDRDPHLACTPYGAYTSEIIGRATDSKGTEHVLWKYIKTQGGHTDIEGHFLIRVTTLMGGAVCGASYDPTADDAITDRIELDTARSLSLQLYQHLIADSGGIEAFRAEFLENLRQRRFDPWDTIVFDSVDVWVWEQVGLDIPRDRYDGVENIDDNYKYDDNGPIGF